MHTINKLNNDIKSKDGIYDVINHMPFTLCAGDIQKGFIDKTFNTERTDESFKAFFSMKSEAIKAEAIARFHNEMCLGLNSDAKVRANFGLCKFLVEKVVKIKKLV